MDPGSAPHSPLARLMLWINWRVSSGSFGLRRENWRSVKQHRGKASDDDGRPPNGCRSESGPRSRRAARAASAGAPHSTRRAAAAQAATGSSDLRTRQFRACRDVRQAFDRAISRHSGRRSSTKHRKCFPTALALMRPAILGDLESGTSADLVEQAAAAHASGAVTACITNDTGWHVGLRQILAGQVRALSCSASGLISRQFLSPRASLSSI
jgi:hypothetical protein